MKDRRYWDSDTFLSWLQGEPGKEDKCQGVLQAAKEGKVVIVTSALTLAEVLKLRHHGALPSSPEARQKVTDFFKHEYIAVANVTRKIAEIGRDLVWDYGIDPKDAIHVATALHQKLPLLNTFDVNLIKHSGKLGDPPLKIEIPDYPYQVQLTIG